MNTKYERMLSKITKLERRSWVWFTYTTKFSPQNIKLDNSTMRYLNSIKHL